MVKPIVLSSSCLEFEKVRYDGNFIPSRIVKDLMHFVEFIRVCPEYAIGLGVPREPIRIVKKGDEYRLIQHKTNKDVTDDMNNFSDKFINELGEVDGFIFKSKSPTMGVSNIKVYSGMKGSPVVERCGGFFAGKISDRYKGYPIEEDDRLRNKRIRDHFLTKLFLFAEFREASNEGKLKDFHKNNSLLLRFYNRELHNKTDPKSGDYFENIKLIMDKPPSSEMIAEFFEEVLQKKDSSIITDYKDNKISLETLKEVSRHILDEEIISGKTFFEPYPKELRQDAESDRDKDYWK